MNAKTQSVVASLFTVGVAIWMLLTPAFTTVTGWALASLLITGGIIALAGLTQLLWENVLPSWVNALAAVWLLVSVFIFDTGTALAWNMGVAAVIGFLLAVWDGTEISQLHHQHIQ